MQLAQAAKGTPMTKRRDLIRELKLAGFSDVGGTKHGKFRKGNVTVTVPRHSEIKNQMADAIRRQAGLK